MLIYLLVHPIPEPYDPDAELHLIDQAGHGTGHPGMTETVLAAIDQFARNR